MAPNSVVFVSSFALLVLLQFCALPSPAESRIVTEESLDNSLINREIEKELSRRFGPNSTRFHQKLKSANPNLLESTLVGGSNSVTPTSTTQDDSDTEISTITPEPGEPESGSSSYVIRMLSKAFKFLNMKKMVKNVQHSRSTPGACITCKFAMTMVKYLIDYGKGFQDVAYVTSYFCKTLNVQTPRVCEGYVNNFMEEFVEAVSKTDLSANEICGTILGDSCSTVNHPAHNWTSTIPDKPRLRKSMFLKPFSFHWPFNQKKLRQFKVLQISDIHIDPEYIEGANAVCGEPLCCRRNSPGSVGANGAAANLPANQRSGYWGDYRDCDVPLRTVEETFRFIRDNHPDIDYVMWTGDIPPHDIWNQTKESQIELIDVVGNLFDQYFGHLPIYPVVGNHESMPMNSFPQPSKDIDAKYSKHWLYEKLSETWLRWLPLETQTTIEKGAFYAVRAKSGLKIISLNTNFCNNQNWWILLNSTDPAQMLEWLVNQLTESEELGEMVHILGHVPPGSNDCYQSWSRNYHKIINRYSHIIKGQFFGHTHNDEFEIFYEDVTPPTTTSQYSYEKTYKATNVAYIGPSITTFGNVNPGYRIYHVDESTYDLADHVTFHMNLTEANAHRNTRPVQFGKAYSAKRAYGLKSLSANEWHKFVMRMRTPVRSEDRVGARMDEATRLWREFHSHFYNLSDDIGEENGCEDESCKYEMLCRLITALSHDTTLCRHFLL